MRFHLIGIGGVGMSPLAEALLDAGHSVSGSDRFVDSGRRMPVFDALESQGAVIFPQDGSGIRCAQPDVVARSSAVEEDNPDIVAAARNGTPVVHRSVALAEALRGKRLVAIAGTCGKSTITGMVGHILDFAGLSPSVVNGAPCVGWVSPARTGAVLKGGGDLCVAEVDESDKSLLNFAPDFALVSNSSPDHFSQSETDALFDEFLAKPSLAPRAAARAAFIDGRKDAAAPEIALTDWGSEFSYGGAEFALNIPGRHNAVNAWQAARLAELAGVPAARSSAALASFKGVKRRMELVGVAPDGTRIVDDYAHNTEKIRAALLALQPLAAQLVALWRPHGYGPLAKMMDELERMFAETLRPGDSLILPPVFDAGGTASRVVQSDALCARLAARGVDAHFAADGWGEAIAIAHAKLRPGAAAVTMGARDPDLPAAALEILKLQTAAHLPSNHKGNGE